MPKIRQKSDRELAIMAKAGQIVADTLLLLKARAVPGVRTSELNALAEHFLQEHGAISSYGPVGFNGVVCTSINEQVVHGIPGNRMLSAGDIIGLDIAAIFDGYHADAAITVPVGVISPQAQHLLQVTEGALALGISLCIVGKHINDISSAVQSYVELHGCSVVRGLVGHGIGQSMWEEPQIPNYRQRTPGPELRQGMTFTIEPMVNSGSHETDTLDDHWTIVTRDRQLSAHFEHTIAITRSGPRILTLPSVREEAWATESLLPGSSVGKALAV